MIVFDYINSFAANSPLLFHSIIILLSFLILIKASNLLVFGAVNYLKKFGVSDYLIGFVLIGVATSLPEFVAALTGDAIGEPGIVFGTFLGASVLTMTFVLGVSVILSRKISLEGGILKDTKYFIPVLVSLPLLLVADGTLSRIDGIIMVVVYLVYITIIWKREGTIGHVKKNVKLDNLWKDGVVFLGALVALLLSARWLVFSSVEVSHILEIPSYFIAVVVIAWGTTVGDLSIGIQSILKGHSGVALGDFFSSFVVDNLLLLGIIAIIAPVVISPWIILPAALFFIIPLSFVVYFAGGKLNWKHGLALVLVYIIFLAVQFLSLR